MRNIQESFKCTRSIVESINNISVNEGIRDLLNLAKNKFKQAYEYLKGFVVTKMGCYYLPLDEQGEIIPAITPLTAVQAYKDGEIDRKNTIVIAGREESKIVGKAASYNDINKLYGSGNSLSYWKTFESVEDEIANVNEVQLENPDPEFYGSEKIVDGEELRDLILDHVSQGPDFPVLFIWGAPGIGKTAIVEEVKSIMQKKYPDYNLLVHILSSDTPDNFLLPKYEGDRATDVPKTWLPVYKPTGDPVKDKAADEALGKGLLFFDEFNRARPDVQSVMLPVINEHRFQEWKIGSGWTVVCASNRLGDDTQTKPVTKTMLSRTAQVNFEPTVYMWEKWARKQNYISPLLLAWLKMPAEGIGGGKYFYFDPDHSAMKDEPTTLMCNPRAWTNAMRILAVYAHTADLEGFKLLDIPEKVIRRALNTTIPASVIDAFLAFLQTISEIGDFDRAVENIWRNDGKGMKIEKSTLRKLEIPLSQLVVSAHAKELPTTEEFKSLANWLVSMNSDQLCSLVLDNFFNIYFIDKGMDSNRIYQEQFMILKKWISMPDKMRATDISSIMNKYKKFFDSWGIRIDYSVFDKDDRQAMLNEMKHVPDYFEGMMIIRKKYGEIFKASKIDGIDALG